MNRGSNDVTVISDFTSGTPVFDTFSTGGIEPVAAFAVTFTGQALESLVVANEGDGLFSLLGGADGLELEQTLSKSRTCPSRPRWSLPAFPATRCRSTPRPRGWRPPSPWPSSCPDSPPR